MINDDLKNRSRIEKILKKYGCDYSAYAFDSLVLWKDAMELDVLAKNDCFFVKCGYKGENSWFFPCGSYEEMTAFIKKHINEKNFSLCYIDETGKNLLNRLFPNVFDIKREENDDEYIYDILGHMELKGGKYANVRTQLHKAKRDYNPHTKPLTDENENDAYEVLSCWNKTAHLYNDAQKFRAVDSLALKYRKELCITGVIVYIDNIPYGTACGYPLSDDTFDLFLAKECGRLPGMGYYVKHELFSYLKNSYRYINIEEDLGIAGLRKMKQSMNPIRKNKMWTAYVKR